MLCERCHKREACLHATKIENHEVKHLHLCEACARAAGFDMETGMVDLQKLAQRWGAALAGREGGEGREEPVTGVCPQCGTESSELQKGHPWPGCPRCYEVFPEELLGTLRRFQGGLRAPVEWGSEAEERRAALEATEKSASLFTGLADEATGEDPAFEGGGVPERSGSPARRRGGAAVAGEGAEAGAGTGEGAAEAGAGVEASGGEATRDGGRRRGAGRRGAARAREERRRLEAALEEAIREERYEAAAELRDRLKELEGGAE